MNASNKREIKEHEKLYRLHDNQLQFRTVDHGQIDGVQLDDGEREYLLPHFLMLLVGKPGSGKTTLLKQLLTNPQMYYRKFDDVFIVSPSHAKMGLKVRKENSTATFSLDWIFGKFAEINEKQLDKVFGSKLKRSSKDKKSANGKQTLASGVLLGDGRSRFLLSDAFNSTPAGASRQQGKAPGSRQPTEEEKVKAEGEYFMQKRYEELKTLPKQQQEKTHRNVLLVLDDVVGQVKKAEFDPRLAQLVMNRRHVIFNGTVSVIFVTQKYTLIPARVRSNANWLILYQLNPNDFEIAYRDAVTLPQQKWFSLLHFVFGVNLREKPQQRQQQEETPAQEGEEEQEEPPAEKVGDVLKSKKFENIGIWVESNMYFKNFKRIKV